MSRSWTRDAIAETVRALLLEHADVEAPVEPATELVADLGIDTLDVMAVVAAIEDRFDLRLGNADLRDLATFGEVVGAIVMRLDAEGRLA